MFKGMESKNVVIIGASGGLGSAFAKSLARSGANLLLVGRSKDKLLELQDSIATKTDLAIADVWSRHSLLALSDTISHWALQVDLIINTVGYDVRKSLEDQSFEEIEEQINTNLLGTILITKTLIRNLKDVKGSTILHIGGFADGRLAFPYYSVDVATRAGMFSFIESLNRELALEGSHKRITYFCPSPTDTEAERPFHDLWKRMGVKIVPIEDVVLEALLLYKKGQSIGIMGGLITKIFAKINSVMPKLADVVTMKKYGKMLQDFLYHKNRVEKKQKSRLAIFLIVLSFALYGLAGLIAFVPLTLTWKAIIMPTFITAGEIVWWIGVAIVGKDVIKRYRKSLNPFNWCCLKVE